MNQASQRIAPAAIRKRIDVKAPVTKAFAVFAARMGEWWHKEHSLAQGIKQVDVIIEPRSGGRWYEVGDDAASMNGARSSPMSRRSGWCSPGSSRESSNMIPTSKLQSKFGSRRPHTVPGSTSNTATSSAWAKARSSCSRAWTAAGQCCSTCSGIRPNRAKLFISQQSE